MKLIYITNNRIPTEKAHGFQIMKMCEAFAKHRSGSTQIESDQRGNFPHESAQDHRKSASINVELWIPKRINAIKENPFRYYNLHETFAIKKISVIDAIPLYKILGPIANIIESISFAIFAFNKLSKVDDYIIYSRDQFTLWLLSFSNKKFVYEIHSFPRNISLYKRIWKRSYKIIAITHGLKNLLTKHGIDPDKIMVAADGVDLSYFNAVNQSKEELKSELGFAAGNFLVGYIGRFKTLGMEKGIKTMIESLALLLDKETKMVFIGGEEAEIRDYRALASRFNVAPQCLFIGYQQYIKAVKYMKAMDVLVIPFPNHPHYAFYASPLKLFEYMASGRPIIASDLPALKEVLNDKNALFFKSGDAADLARAIKMVKSSPMLGYHLSQQALADVKEYTWDKRAQKILEFIRLQSLISKP